MCLISSGRSETAPAVSEGKDASTNCRDAGVCQNDGKVASKVDASLCGDCGLGEQCNQLTWRCEEPAASCSADSFDAGCLAACADGSACGAMVASDECDGVECDAGKICRSGLCEPVSGKDTGVCDAGVCDLDSGACVITLGGFDCVKEGCDPDQFCNTFTLECEALTCVQLGCHPGQLSDQKSACGRRAPRAFELLNSTAWVAELKVAPW